MRRILYVSGTRADYGPARRTLRALAEADDFVLGVLVCGMHLDPAHGETWREIASDGLDIVESVPGRLSGDSAAVMAATVGLYLYGMASSIQRWNPDIVLLLGDRGEMLAAAMAAAFQNVFVAHLTGGSLSGSIDDSIRHAITKFAHLHLPAFDESARRIVQMGEDPNTVHVVGLPGGDLRPDVTYSRAQTCAFLGVDEHEPYLLVVQHPVTHSAADAEVQVAETLEAVAATGLTALLANPNDDAGGRILRRTMEEYSARHPRLRMLPPPASRERFASVVAHAAAQVGNSSSAIVEAMSVGVPVVNIGDRQRGREQLSCMVNVGYERSAILAGIRTALANPEYRERLLEHVRRLSALDTPTLVAGHLRTADLGAARRPKPFRDSLPGRPHEHPR